MIPQVPTSRLAQLVAPIIGLTAWPIALFFEVNVYYSFARPAVTIVPILLSASLAGLIIGTLAGTREDLLREDGLNEWPTRGGFIAALVAAALLVVRTTLAHAQPGQLTGIGLVTLFSAVVALMPATLFAMFMGALAGAGRIAVRGSPDLGKPAFTFRPIHALYVVCLLAMLAPLVPGFLSKPAPPSAASRIISSRDAPALTPGSELPSPPSFDY